MSSSDRLPDQLTDKLTIETPEQTPLEFPLAGIGSRFLALAFDTLIQFAAISLLGIVSLLLAPSIGKSWQALYAPARDPELRAAGHRSSSRRAQPVAHR